MKVIRIAQMLALAGIMTLPTVAMGQDSKPADGKGSEIARLAETADTPAKHADVAKQFRARAADLTAAAVKHEAEVKRLERERFPVEHKQPAALANRPLMRERQLAMEARRGAREALAQAELHTQLAVELLASR